VCVCVLIGSSQYSHGQELWAERYPTSSAEPGGIEIPVGVAGSLTHAYAGGSRSLGGGSVFVVVQHDLVSGAIEGDYQWPFEGSESLSITARAMTFLPNPNSSFMEVVLTGVFSNEEGYLRPVTISVLGNESGEEMQLQWSSVDVASADQLGNDVPIALALAAHPNGPVGHVGILTDTDGARGRFRVYIHDIGTGRLRGQINFPSSMWEGQDDIPVGLALTPTEAWVACTHIGQAGLKTARVYRFGHAGQLLQAPLEVFAHTGSQLIVKAARMPHSIAAQTEAPMLMACQDINTAAGSSDILTVVLEMNTGSGLLEVRGTASRSFGFIDTPTTIDAWLGQTNTVPGGYHIDVAGTTKPMEGGETDIVVVQYSAPTGSPPFNMAEEWFWEAISLVPTPLAKSATWGARSTISC
jgi:hypothetical protein